MPDALVDAIPPKLASAPGSVIDSLSKINNIIIKLYKEAIHCQLLDILLPEDDYVDTLTFTTKFKQL